MAEADSAYGSVSEFELEEHQIDPTTATTTKCKLCIFSVIILASIIFIVLVIFIISYKIASNAEFNRSFAA